MQVERDRPDVEAPVLGLGPGVARAVAVDLDAVAVGVAQVERLADEVVGRARELHPAACRVLEPAGEPGAVRQQQREVEETGARAAAGPGPWLLLEHHEVAPRDTHADRAALA